MTGVEVLSEKNIYVMESCWWLIPAIAGFILLIVFIIFTIEWISTGFEGWHIPIMILIAIISIFVGYLIAGLAQHETDTIDYIEYKVTIDDSVSMTEFMDKYEILDQEGKIYTIKEKE